MLFSAKNGLNARRILTEKFSNSDENPVSITLKNNYKFNIEAKIIDELPNQFQKRDFEHIVNLKPVENYNFEYEVTPVERGEYHFGNLNIYVSSPLKIVANGTIDRDILFDEKNFMANLPLEAVYKFNSYRLTYNRRIISNDKFKFGLGFSAKIRDAGTSLKNKELLSENFSIGFVPLINLITNWDISQKMGIDFFGEGIAAPKIKGAKLMSSTLIKNDRLESWEKD